MDTVRLLILIIFSFFASYTTADAEFLPKTIIQHEQEAYFIPGSRLQLVASLNDTKEIIEARCYFKTDADKNYLYSPMYLRSGDIYQCTIPALKTGSKILQYFFLIVNGQNQSVRSTPFLADELAGEIISPQNNTPVSPTLIYVHSELGYSLDQYPNITDVHVQMVSKHDLKELYGLRAGIYEESSIPATWNCANGYFGGFIYDIDTDSISPVKGFAPGLKKPVTFESTSTQSNLLLQSMSTEVISAENNIITNATVNTQGVDISGNNWTGYYSRTDNLAYETITSASIVQNGSYVEITTSKQGLGHHFTGTINSSGDMLIYDSYDGEDWSTHYGPATSLDIAIYDFIWRPTLSDPNPPLNYIILHRDCIVEPCHIIIPPIISPLLLGG